MERKHQYYEIIKFESAGELYYGLKAYMDLCEDISQLIQNNANMSVPLKCSQIGIGIATQNVDKIRSLLSKYNIPYHSTSSIIEELGIRLYSSPEDIFNAIFNYIMDTYLYDTISVSKNKASIEDKKYLYACYQQISMPEYSNIEIDPSNVQNEFLGEVKPLFPASFVSYSEAISNNVTPINLDDIYEECWDRTSLEIEEYREKYNNDFKGVYE